MDTGRIRSVKLEVQRVVSTQVEDNKRTHYEGSERRYWWLCEEQSIVAVKQARFRELLSCRERNQEDRIRAQVREPEGREDVVDPNRLPHVDCYYSRISQAEVRTDLHEMGRNKAVRLDQISIEAWRRLEDEGIFWLTNQRDAKMLWTLAGCHMSTTTTQGSARRK
ncbi:hypothetical protein Tco_1150891 [Tanacetum coccineum]